MSVQQSAPFAEREKRQEVNADPIMTPYGPAVSFADAVVLYAMHGEKCPLGIAQTARDQFEEISEELRVTVGKARLEWLLANPVR